MRKTLIITLLFLWPFDLIADFSCDTEVAYTWKREDQEKKVIYKHLNADYANEDLGKQELKKLGERAKMEALQECSRNHENFANCIVSKLKNLAGTAAAIGFKSREMLESAVEQDCKVQTGVCLDSSMTDIVCQAKASAEPPPSPTAEEEGKDKKKK